MISEELGEAAYEGTYSVLLRSAQSEAVEGIMIKKLFHCVMISISKQHNHEYVIFYSEERIDQFGLIVNFYASTTSRGLLWTTISLIKDAVPYQEATAARA